MPPGGLYRISQYVADMPGAFDSLDDAERYLREVLAPFGNVADEHWRHLTTHSVRRDPEQGVYLTLCDPAILQALKAPANPGAHLWAYWDAIDHPILVVRGRDSDFLPSYLSKEMARRNPHAIVHDVPGCGHAPTLMPRDQVEAVAAFLTTGAGDASIRSHDLSHKATRRPIIQRPNSGARPWENFSRPKPCRPSSR